MVKLDKLNRIHIPKRFLLFSKIPLESKMGLFFKDEELYIDSLSNATKKNPCLSIIRLDKYNNFFASQLVRKQLGIFPGSYITVYLKDGKITLSKQKGQLWKVVK